MLVKSRDERIQTMREVKEQLDAIAAALRPAVPEALAVFDEPSVPVGVALAADNPGALLADPVWIAETWLEEDHSRLAELEAPPWEVEVWP
jgi:hypothetical protein